METHYRDATPADIPAIDALFRRSFTATFGHLYAARDLATFLARFTPQGWADEFTRLRFRLAESEHGLLGYAKFGAVALPVSPAGMARELWQLYVAEEAKGSGIADALMRWAIEAARADRANELFLSVYTDNHRAKRFYARHGFADVGPYTFMVGNHADEDRIYRLIL